MPLACSDAGRRCRRRGASACRLQPSFQAGDAGGEASSYAACMQCCWQVLPAPWLLCELILAMELPRGVTESKGLIVMTGLVAAMVT